MSYEFMAFHSGSGVPDEVGDFDPSLAPPLGSYTEVKELLDGAFPGITWNDEARNGELDIESGTIEFDCSDILLDSNMFSISTSMGEDLSDSIAYLEPRLSAAGLAALDGENLQFIGGDAGL